MPHNNDAEMSILGGVLLRNEVLAQIPDVGLDAFFDMKNQVVFKAMRNLEARRIPLDVVTLQAEIERNGELEAIGGVAYLGELALRVPTTDNVRHYADEVLLLARNRRAIMTLGTALERAYTWPHEPDELVGEIAGELQRIEIDARANDGAEQRQRWTIPLAEFLDEEEPNDDDAEDWIIRDLVPRAEPVLWGGPMKGGKTWAVMDLLISIALGESWLGAFENTLGPAKCLGIFLEDNKRRIGKRLWELCRSRGTTPRSEFLQERLRLSRASLRLPDGKDLRRLIAEARVWKPRVIVVDNLTRVMVGDPNSTRDASAFTRAWTELGDETGATVLFLHHTKKALGEDRDADPFDLLRGSGDFGATARNIVVTKPIRTDDSGPKLAEVRMRGNLDLRRESFVLGFERKELLGRWHAKLSDLGEVEQVKDDAAKSKREAAKAKKREEHGAEMRRRRDLALSIVHKRGSVSQAVLALELGVSPRTLAPLFEQLTSGPDAPLEPAGKKGYVLKVEHVPSASAQGSML
jgi:hypothetical protein